MLSVNRLKFIAAEKLVPGQFARLSDYGNALVVVGTIHTRTMVVWLEGAREGVTCEDLSDLYGRAMVYDGVKIEVDPNSWTKNTDELGSLMRDNSALAVQVKTSYHNTFCLIRSDLDESSTHRAFFESWRAVIREGDRDEVLFEFKAEQANQIDAVLHLEPAQLAAINPSLSSESPIG